MNELLEIAMQMNDEDWAELSAQRKFWKTVDMRDPKECWFWMGTRDKQTNYGVASYRGKDERAHRLSYKLFYGEEIPKWYVVRHKCDNKRCCNPHHLELGTHFDNVWDWHRRLINQKGENNFASKLTEVQVKAIRQKVANGEQQQIVARDFGVSVGSVSQIISGWTWKETFKGDFRKRQHCKLTKDQMQSIVKEYSPTAMSMNRLGKKYKVSRATIRRILNGDYEI